MRSFRKATELNAEIWSFVHCGHDDVWKRKELPGSPATLAAMNAARLAEESER